MTPALQRELDRLQANLAARRAAPAVAATEAAPPQRDPEPEGVHRDDPPESIRETTASFSPRQVARVAAALNRIARRCFARVYLFGCAHAGGRSQITPLLAMDAHLPA